MLWSMVRKIQDFLSDDKFSEILKGSIWALAARVIAAVMALQTSIIVSRFFGAEVVGSLALMDSFMLLASVIAVLGMDTAVLRLIPEHLAKHSPGSAFIVYRKILYSVSLAALFVGFGLFLVSPLIAEKVFNNPYLIFYFSYGAVFVIFKSVLLLNIKAIRALKLIKVFAFLQILPHFTNIILIVILWKVVHAENTPLYAQLSSIALTCLFSLGIIAYVFRKRATAQDVICSISFKELWSISLPMLLATSMTIIIAQTGVIILGIYRPEVDVGYYSIASKLATLTTFVLGAINTITAPKFAELFHLGKIEELFYVAKKSSKLVFWLTTPILLIFLFFGKQILGSVYGEDFIVAYPALCILVAGQFANSISGSTSIFMNMTGNQKVFKNIMLSTACLNILLNIVLVPSNGLNGSALAASICLCYWNLVTLIYIKIKYGQTTGYFLFNS